MAWQSGEIDDAPSAEKHGREALAIQERLAPGSLSVATTCIRLGNAADDRNDLGTAEDWYLKALSIREAMIPMRSEPPTFSTTSASLLGNAETS